MPNLQSDIIGQVARLPLRPSEANALLPLHEAISNSLHAIIDRFRDARIGKEGRIDIEVLRSDDNGSDSNVRGFKVTDNGVGLNDVNFTSFCTPFSQHKVTRGGKGIGRLGWLKIFTKIKFESAYENEGSVLRRNFNFVLREADQIELFSAQPSVGRQGPGSVVTLLDFKEAFGSRCPTRAETIRQRIIAHFLPVFAGEASPAIYVHDDDGISDLRAVFDSMISQQIEVLLDVEILGENQPILVKHMRCDRRIRPRGTNNNWMCFCADDRGVKEYGIDEQIGLKLLSDGGIYVGAVTGDYLDKHVNPQRTDFTFDTEEGRSIRRQVANSIKDFLKGDVDASTSQKRALSSALIQKNPQYLYLTSELDSFVSRLAPNSNNEETIYLEMSQDRFRRQRRFNGIRSDIDAAPAFNEAVAQKVEEYKNFIQLDQKGNLAEYVTKRKAVLDLLDKLRGFSDLETETQHLENAIHELVCPMRFDSDGLDIEDHNCGF